MNYGNAIRVSRAARRMSQKDLAVRLNLDASYLSLLEKGTRKPSLTTLEDVARVLDIPLDLLLLLASEKDDLRSVTQDQVSRLGQQVLDMIASGDLGQSNETAGDEANR